MAIGQPANTAAVAAGSDIDAAMVEAIRIVQEEKKLPEAIREVQRKNLLRWLQAPAGA